MKVSVGLGVVAHNDSSVTWEPDAGIRSFIQPSRIMRPHQLRKQKESCLSASELMNQQAMKVCLTLKPVSSVTFTSLLV